MRAAERADTRDGQQCAADIARVRHYDKPGVRPQQRLHGFLNQGAVLLAWNAGKSDAELLKLPQRTHDRIMLHRGDQHMVARAEKAFEQDVETFGDVFGEHNALAVLAVKQRAELLPCRKDEIFRRVGRAVAAATDVAAAAG